MRNQVRARSHNLCERCARRDLTIPEPMTLKYPQSWTVEKTTNPNESSATAFAPFSKIHFILISPQNGFPRCEQSLRVLHAIVNRLD